MDENQNQKLKKSESEYDQFPYNIPDEIIVEILLRVPVTSLMRFKCVSKSWHALFSNDKFITSHVNINLNRGVGHKHVQLMENVYICGLSLHPTSPMLYSLKYMLKQVPPVPATVTVTASDSGGSSKTAYDYYYDANCMMRSCDGLICIFKKPNSICIWNPTTRKARNLPLLKPKKPAACFEFIGFGYYEPTNDYKVVAFQCPYDVDAVDYEADCVLHVYSLNTHRWDSVKYNDLGFACPSQSTISGVFLNNKPYWLENPDAVGIRCFDLASCEFEAIEEPHGLDYFLDINGNGSSLRVLDGHVCLGYNFKTRMDLWLLNEHANKEYTWTKFVSINHSCVLDVLHIFKKGEILTVVEDKYQKRWLMLYDSQVSSQTMLLAIPKHVEIQMKPIIHVPSLISIALAG